MKRLIVLVVKPIKSCTDIANWCILRLAQTCGWHPFATFFARTDCCTEAHNIWPRTSQASGGRRLTRSQGDNTMTPSFNKMLQALQASGRCWPDLHILVNIASASFHCAAFSIALMTAECATTWCNHSGRCCKLFEHHGTVMYSLIGTGAACVPKQIC